MPKPTIEEKIGSLDELLACLAGAGDESEPVTLGEVVEAIGRRSFGPLLLLAGLIVFSPLSGIPGLPTIMAGFVLLIAGQLICRRRYFWLPRWLLARRVSRKCFNATIRILRRPARAVDRLLRPRLHILVGHAGLGVILLLSVALALIMPVLELFPFASSVAGAALTAFGLALIAHDGVLALLAIGTVGGGGWALVAIML